MHDTVLNNPKNLKYDGYQRGLALIVYKIFYKKFSIANASNNGIKNEVISNHELAEQLNKPIIRNFEKLKVHLSFMDNICGADLVDMHLIRKFNKVLHFEYRFLLYVVDIFKRYE